MIALVMSGIKVECNRFRILGYARFVDFVLSAQVF